MEIGKEYLRVVIERFKSVKNLGDKTIAQLSEEDMHWTYNSESNSIAIIIKHLSGNMISRWTDFLTTDGEKDDRNRDQEFIDDIIRKADLVDRWEKGWDVLFRTLGDLKEQDLLKESQSAEKSIQFLMRSKDKWHIILITSGKWCLSANN